MQAGSEVAVKGVYDLLCARATEDRQANPRMNFMVG